MRRFILLAMVAGLALTTLARPAVAATRTPFSALMTNQTNLDPGTSWVSGKTFHLRDAVDQWDLSGDLEGTAIVVANFDGPIDGPGGAGWGTFVFTTQDVTYEGSYVAGHFEGQGSDGSNLVNATYTFVEDGILLEGVVVAP